MSLSMVEVVSKPGFVLWRAMAQRLQQHAPQRRINIVFFLGKYINAALYKQFQQPFTQAYI